MIAVTGCDITVASENAIFGYPEGKAGVSQVPPQYVPYMPYKIALEFMLLSWKGGRMMSARRAYEVGLVNAVVPDEQLADEAVRWAEMLRAFHRSSSNRSSMATIKELSGWPEEPSGSMSISFSSRSKARTGWKP